MCIIMGTCSKFTSCPQQASGIFICVHFGGVIGSQVLRTVGGAYPFSTGDTKLVKIGHVCVGEWELCQQDIKPNRFQHKTIMLTSSTLITNVYNYLYSRKQCSSLVSVWRSLGDAYLKCHIVKKTRGHPTSCLMESTITGRSQWYYWQ